VCIKPSHVIRGEQWSQIVQRWLAPVPKTSVFCTSSRFSGDPRRNGGRLDWRCAENTG
jgi:hypothetical protein